MQRIVITGSYPPPHAGNSVHIQKLTERLVADGYPVTVVDPYNVQTLRYAGREAGCAPGPETTHGLRSLGLVLARDARGAIVHFHMSAGKRFYRVAPLLLALTRKASKRVVTIHSGSFLKEFRLLGPVMRRLARWVLGRFEDVICVNEQQYQALRPQLPGRLHVIPAFLPPRVDPDLPAPESVRQLQAKVDVTLVTSGTGEPLYDYDTLLRGLELAQRQTPRRLGLVVATYKAWDSAYWEPMERRLRASSVPVVITRSLSPDEFVALLARAQIYVRCTLADGDAIAIREAAAVGAQVLATDAAPRPAGTALFPMGDAERLAEWVVQAAQDRSVGRLPPESSADTYHALLEVYGLSGAVSQPAACPRGG
jgi:glycosyltransferase involved in cell wall biosynthesis